MKIVNNTDNAVVVRWKRKTVDQSVEITLCQLFPYDVDHMPGRTISAVDALKHTDAVHAAWKARRNVKEETSLYDKIQAKRAEKQKT